MRVGIDWAVGPDRTVIMVLKKETGEVVELPPVRMHGNWLLVQLDPEQDVVMSGLLYKPADAHEHVLRTGTIVLTGPGKWAEKPDKATKTYRRIPLGVEIGERVLFVKFAVTHTETSKRIQQVVGKDFGMIQPHDILLAGPDVDKVTQ